MARYTDKKAARYCNEVLKCAREWMKDKPDLHTAWEDNFGRTFVCDGFRAYRLEKRPNGLEEIWTVHVHKETKAERERRERVHNGIEAMFDGNILENMAPVPVEYADVMTAYKTSEDWTMDLGEDFPVVNVKYLRQAMEMLPGAKVYCQDNARRMVSPVYVISENGVALILPIRRENKLHWTYRKGA